MSDDRSDRTLPASPRRRAEAWSTGPVPRSSALVSAAVLLAATAYGMARGSRIVLTSARWLQSRWLETSPTMLSSNDLIQLVQQSLWAGISLAGGLILTALSAAIVIELLQSGFRLSPQRLVPNPERMASAAWRQTGGNMSPLGGIGETFRWLAPLALFGLLLWDHWPQLAALLTSPPIDMIELAGDLGLQLIWRIWGLLLLLGIAHYVWVRLGWERSLRMTPAEHREELRGERRRLK